MMPIPHHHLNPAIQAVVLVTIIIAVAWGGLSETFAAFLISRIL